MSAVVNITINGQALAAQAGQTVMEAASAAGIWIPGLCNHPHLKPEGACRLCLVEIEKQRAPQPACTFPVTEGMVVRTETEAIKASRVFALQMIFSERSHYCMICPESGPAGSTDCELQELAYRCGMDHWEPGPNFARAWPMDASRAHFVMDHGRCILCRRCVRACNALAANHTLGVHERGARTMIGADDDVPFGESTCISCGTCLQVCPTGALMDRWSLYAGRAVEAKATAAVCLGCAVGCRTQVYARDNQVLRVEGDWNGPNGGLLCSTGRFESVGERAPRILWPLVRQGEKLVDASWDLALDTIAAKFSQAERVAGLISPRLTNESLAAIECFFNEVLQSNELALLYGAAPPVEIGARAELPDLAGADCIVVIAGDPLEEQKVAGYLIRRAVDAGAQLIVVSDARTALDAIAKKHLPLRDIAAHEGSPFARLQNIYHLSGSGISQLRMATESAQRPVVCYGHGLSVTVHNALRSLPRKVKFLPLVIGTNALGAARLGLTERPVWGEALYANLGDDLAPANKPMPEHAFSVVQAAYESAWTAAADVVLPALTWPELSGHIINMEAKARQLQPIITPHPSIHTDPEVLKRLAERMGCGTAFSELATMTANMRD